MLHSYQNNFTASALATILYTYLLKKYPIQNYGHISKAPVIWLYNFVIVHHLNGTAYKSSKHEMLPRHYF